MPTLHATEIAVETGAPEELSSCVHFWVVEVKDEKHKRPRWWICKHCLARRHYRVGKMGEVLLPHPKVELVVTQQPSAEVDAHKVQQCPPHHWALDETSYGVCNLCGEERQFDRGQPNQNDSLPLAVPSVALAQTEQRLPAIESWDPFRPIDARVLAHIIQGTPTQEKTPNTFLEELLRLRKRAGKNRLLPPPLTEKELQAIVAQEQKRELPTLFVPALAPLRALPG